MKKVYRRARYQPSHFTGIKVRKVVFSDPEDVFRIFIHRRVAISGTKRGNRGGYHVISTGTQPARQAHR